MKWIGQHIWSFISRFRNDVYLEDISDAGSDTDKFLVAESDGKIAYRTGAEVLSDIGASSESTDLEFNGSTANGVLTYGGAAQIDVESTLTFDPSSGSILNVNGMKLRASSGGSFSYNGSTFTSYIQLPSFEAIGDLGIGGIIKVEDGTGTDVSGAALSLESGDANGTNMDGGDMRFNLGARTGSGDLAHFLFYGSDAGAQVAKLNDSQLTIGVNDDSEYTIERRTHSDGDGGILEVKAGSATNGQTNKNGGNLELHGGLSTGAAAGGDIKFYSHKRGASGTTLGTEANIASIQPGTANTDFIIYEDAGASTDDYYRVRVSANGETLVTTHDAAAMAAHYKVDADGDITFDPATGVVRAGWHGSTTRIKILHSDFIADDGGRPLMIDDTGVASENLFLETYSTFPAYVTIAIPSGYKATHVMIHGSGTGAVEVWEHQIDSKTGVSKGTGNVETEINITDVTSSSTNYLFIQVAAGSDEIHGGYVTIVAV
jgi:hypothetical protein